MVKTILNETYVPLGDWESLNDNIINYDSNTEEYEYLFFPMNEDLEPFTYFKGGEKDGHLVIESKDFKELKEHPDWKQEIISFFTEKTGLPVTHLEVI
jgi:hypothetical protein